MEKHDLWDETNHWSHPFHLFKERHAFWWWCHFWRRFCTPMRAFWSYFSCYFFLEAIFSINLMTYPPDIMDFTLFGGFYSYFWIKMLGNLSINRGAIYLLDSLSQIGLFIPCLVFFSLVHYGRLVELLLLDGIGMWCDLFSRMLVVNLKWCIVKYNWFICFILVLSFMWCVFMC